MDARATLLAAATRHLAQELPAIPLYSAVAARIVPRDLVFPARSDGLLLLAEASYH